MHMYLKGLIIFWCYLSTTLELQVGSLWTPLDSRSSEMNNVHQRPINHKKNQRLGLTRFTCDCVSVCRVSML